jgi:hypothetical protein
VFDKPLYPKPELGSLPSFLSEGEHVSLGTTALFRRCLDALKSNKAYAAGAFDEYCNAFSSNLERFRLLKYDGEFDEAVVKNIEEFIPYRNEAIQLLIGIAQYSPTTEFIQRIHRLFESLIPYLSNTGNVRESKEWDFDNFKFLVHELFLYAMAVLLRHDRLDQGNYLLEQQYYVPGNSEYGKDAMVSFMVFRQYLKSLEHRNNRLSLRRLSLRADLLKERCTGTGIDFLHLQQADFVVFMRGEIEGEDNWTFWWPETLLYLGHSNSPFEIFARSVSKAYFDRAKVLLAIKAPTDLEPLWKSYQSGARTLPRWNFTSFKPASLLGYNNLATKP